MENKKTNSPASFLKSFFFRDYDGMASWTRAALVLYYLALAGYSAADHFYGAGGPIRDMGRLTAAAFVLIVFPFATRGAGRRELEAELYGGREDDPFADIWRLVNLALFYLSLLASAYFFYRREPWTGLLYMAQPAWRCWLRMALRRALITTGELRPSPWWGRARLLSALAAIPPAVMLLSGSYGPLLSLGGFTMRAYPAVFVAAMLGILVTTAAGVKKGG